MEKSSKTKRTTEEVLISFFPEIDKKALREILKDEEQTVSPGRKRKSLITDDIIESPSKFKKEIDFNVKENEQLDKMFTAKDAKEKNYLNAVKKSVTTSNLPNVLNKGIPKFLSTNIKKIYAITGKAGYFVTNRLRLSALKSDDIVFTNFVTGSDDTDYCFDLLTKNFCTISEKHKCVFVFIVPKFETDATANFKNKKDNIINKYSISMRYLDTDRFFFSTEPSKPNDFPSTLAQFYKHCSIFPFSFSFFGFTGLKGPTGDKQLLEKNIRFLMKYHKEPFIINKCDLFETKEKDSISLKTTRTDKDIEEIRSYSWLFVFDRINSNCFNCFNSFSKLIDFKKDKISALTLLPSYVLEDDIKPKFTKELNSKKIEKFNYSCESYRQDANIIVKNAVNYGDEIYDFVVIYNSYNNSEINKAIYEKQNASNYSNIMECYSNVCIHNGL